MNIPSQWQKIEVGTWLYDGAVPRHVDLYRIPAIFAASRYDGDDQLDDSQPIPETPDGYVYRVWGSEFGSKEEAIQWANQQPWGPVRWGNPLEPKNR